MVTSSSGQIHRRIASTVAGLARSAPGRAWSAHRIRRLAALHASVRLHLGCGARKLPGWINIDYVYGADVILDLRRPIPLHDGTVDLIYSEDFLEHLNFQSGRALLAECARLLRSGGRLRLATPDLARLTEAYQSRSERSLVWYRDQFPGISTFAQMFNTGMRAWGHQFLYDEETLRGVLEVLGFQVERLEFSESSDPDLRGLELRSSEEGAQSMYIEAQKA